jgi:hypothetical protein
LGSLAQQTSFNGKTDVLYIVADRYTGVISIGGDDGAVIWRANVTQKGMAPGLAKSATIGGDGTVCVWDGGDDAGNSVYAIRDGAQVWTVQTGGTENPVITKKGTVYVEGWGARPSTSGEEFYLKLFSVNRGGQVQWMFAPAPPPVWSKHMGKNCYDGHGATSMDQSPIGKLSMADCEKRCDETAGCGGITVVWSHNGEPTDCWRRSNINIDACDSGDGYDTWTKSAPTLAPVPPGLHGSMPLWV